MTNDEMLKVLIKEYNLPPSSFLTGSRAFGSAKTDSDWDICFPIHAMKDLRERLPALEDSPYNNGFTTIYDGQEINFIPLHPLDQLAWYLATDTFERICRINSIKNKITLIDNRHGMFEMLRGFMKTSINYNGQIDIFETIHYLMDEKRKTTKPIETTLHDDIIF